MRKLLYISIGISLAIVVVALAHYQWRAHKLGESIARLPNRNVEALDSRAEAPVVSRQNVVVESVVESKVSGDSVSAIDGLSTADYEAAFLKFDELYEAFQKEVAAFYEEYQDYEEWLARDTPWKRKSAELQPKLAQMEADAYAAERALARANARLARLDIRVPEPSPDVAAAIDAAIEEALGDEESFARTMAQHGDIAGFIDHLAKTRAGRVSQ